MKRTIYDSFDVRSKKGDYVGSIRYKLTNKKNEGIKFFVLVNGKGYVEYPFEYRFRSASLSIHDAGWLNIREAIDLFTI